MFQNIKKYLISSGTVILFVVYVVYQRVSDANLPQNPVGNLPNENKTTDVVPVGSTSNTPTQPVQSLPTTINNQVKKFVNQFGEDEEDDGTFIPKPAVTPTPTATKPVVTTPVSSKPVVTKPVTQTAGIYKDGTYNGSSVFARDGYLQTQAVIQGGKLVDVKFPVLPNGSGYSTNVSSYALPILRTEAIQAQSANVNAVSQATLTSASFNESLGVALASAKK